MIAAARCHSASASARRAFCFAVVFQFGVPVVVRKLPGCGSGAEDSRTRALVAGEPCLAFVALTLIILRPLYRGWWRWVGLLAHRVGTVVADALPAAPP
jgi:hypothetical protein